MLELLRHADPNMRRGAAETLLQFSKLLEGAPLALRKQLTSRTTLSLLILGLKVRTLTIVATDTAVRQGLDHSAPFISFGLEWLCRLAPTIFILAPIHS